MHSYQLLLEIVMVKLMKMYIKLQAEKRFLFMYFLLFSVIGVHSQYRKIYQRGLSPIYMIIHDEVASKINFIHSLNESLILNGYMYYTLEEDETFTWEQFKYYIEVWQDFYGCQAPDGVVTDKNGIPFLCIDKEEIESGFFKATGDSVWIEYYHNEDDLYPNGDCIPHEDIGPIIKTYDFSFILPQDIDSTWVMKNMIYRYRYRYSLN